MKKSLQRILCLAMSATMLSSLAIEQNIRIQAEESTGGSVSETTNRQMSITDVTGKFDTSALREANFNTSVLETEQTATYEKKTVIVSLDEQSLLAKANGEEVSSFAASWSGEMAKQAIEKQQSAFLQKLSQKGISYTLSDTYSAVDNAVAIEVNTKYVSTIQEMSGVESVVVSNTYLYPSSSETGVTGLSGGSASDVTNKTSVYKTGIYDSSAYKDTYSGKGMKVAILDTGLDYTHDAYQSFMSSGTWEGMWEENDIEDLLKTGDFAAERTSSAAELYVSAKVPFAYDYADKDADVYPSYSNHGTHVAGIVAGYDPNGYTDKDGNHINETFIGVAPDAQLVICKVFTDDLDSKDLGGAVSEDILAALEDCVLLGVDVINMSLGTTAGFSTTVGDAEGDYMQKVYDSIQTAGISLIAAASNDYSSSYGGAFGTNLASNPDSATIGSPSTYSAALSVASISGKKSPYVLANAGDATHEKAVFFEEANDENSNPYDFAKELLGEGKTTGTFKYVVIPNVGRRADYSDSIIKAVKGNIALVERGDTTFQEKVETARAMGAAGIIVYNNVPGVIRMMLGEIEESKRIPAISINMKSGEAMVKAATSGDGLTGTFTINIDEYAAGPFMSEFSSWGPTPDLKLKPEITAHGGEITSTVPGGYGEQSGTSMASPNMAGFAALVRSYIEAEMSAEVQRIMTAYGVKESVAVNRLVNQLTMSTATIAVDQDGYAYSPRKQGAGLASLDHILAENGRTQAYIYTDNAGNDYRPKVELGDTPELGKLYDHNNAKDGDYTETLSFKVRNFGASALTFGMKSIVMTESVASDGLAVAEQAYILDDLTPEWRVGGAVVTGDTITVEANSEISVEVIVSLSADEIKYIKNSFRNGMYVEGFVQLTSETQSDLTMPFLGFLGDWTDGTMLDWSAYELSEKEQDSSIPDEEKPQASVYATQPFTSYYNETYVLPMGGYVYLLPEEADPMYAKEEYASVSRYNDYVSTSGVGNYMTSTSIKAVYTGLLRNASRVDYRMYNTETGELILTDTIHRVGKAYSGGGSSRPANVELNIFPDEFGLVQNGQYTMEFDFYLAYGDQDVLKEDNKFEFSFTVDYDAPILENASVRYQTTKVNNVEKNQIYLDLEIYDNHYPQSVMLCYLDQDKVTGDDILVLATEYIEPVRKAVRNGISKVSLDITDIYDEYKGELYVQLDDYALNNCVYMLDYESVQGADLPDTFNLADGEEEITIAVNETHKVKLDYEGKMPVSNFLWDTSTKAFVAVQDGEIVGLRKGTGWVSVSNDKGVTKNIKVNVTDEVKPLKLTGISFGIIETYSRSLQKAQGSVKVNAGQEFTLEIIPEPWYYPVKNLEFEWSTSSDSFVQFLDDNGKVRMMKEGVASVTASVKGGSASTSVFFDIQDEFTVANYTLSDYNGVGYNGEICQGCGEAFTYDELVSAKDDATNTRNKCPDCGAVVEGGTKLLIVPDDLNVMYIGEEAFKDNDNIEYIVLPKMLTQINQRAFINCTALKGVYFDSVKETAIDDCEISLMNDEVFYGCTKLEFIDLRNTKTFTVGKYCFAGCTALSEIKEMQKIGTMHHYAFQDCTALTQANLEGLHMSGRSVFSGCTNLATVTTGKFTAIGERMFEGCNKIKSIEIKTPKIGARAFANLSGLESVTFTADANSDLLFDIGSNAFASCESLATVDFGNANIRSIGDRAFANTAISSFTVPSGLKTLGNNILSDTNVASVKLSDDFAFESLNMLGCAFSGVSIDVTGLTNYKMTDGVLFNQDGSKLLLVTKDAANGEYKVANSVQEIFAYAFANSKFSKVTFENGGSAITLGEGAFSGAALTAIDFGGRTLNSIPANAFASSKLASITIPATVQTIGDNAFERSSIASVTFAKDDNENYAIQTLGNGVFTGCNALTNIALPAQITTMGDSTFANCQTLTSVTMPAVTSLGARTFVGASSLQTVVFDENATTAGTFTFMNTPVQSVTLGTQTTKIEDGYYYFLEGYIGYDQASGLGSYEISQGVFSGCTSLQEVIMQGVTYVGLAAFENCKKLSLDVSKLTHVGNRAFYNCNALSSINLANATYVGDYAFAVDNGGAAASTVTIPAAQTVGEFAFYGNNASEIAIGAATTKIGQGAFANAKSLQKFTVHADNKAFIADDGVLYRYFVLGSDNGETVYSNGEYELVAYPGAKTGANGSYTALEGTLAIKGYAFNGLKSGALSKIELPYSVNTIGDAAFYQSGIKEYTLNSMQAPELESVFVKSVADEIDAAQGIYKGLYYRNFNDAIADYRDPTLSAFKYDSNAYQKTSSKLVLNYPVNAKGYDNYVYRQYFGVRNTTAVAMEDYTRECVNMIEALPTAAEVSAMTTSNTTKDEVVALSDAVKLARTYFNNIKDETQISFIGSANAEKLLAVETALKAVKNAFGITVAVKKITYDKNSYKSTYYVGETFDPTGLQFTIEYEDGSTENADLSQFTLNADRAGALESHFKYVTYTHNDSGKTARVVITVQAKPVVDDGNDSSDSSGTGSDSSSDNSGDSSDSSSSNSGAGDATEPNEGLSVGAIIAICVGGAVVLAAAGGFVFLKVKGLTLQEVFAKPSAKKPEEKIEAGEDKEDEIE